MSLLVPRFGIPGVAGGSEQIAPRRRRGTRSASSRGISDRSHARVLGLLDDLIAVAIAAFIIGGALGGGLAHAGKPHTA